MTRVPNIISYPNSIIGKLRIIYHNLQDPTDWDVYTGTGFLVGNKYVFTAAHNVFFFPGEDRTAKWAYPDRLEFYPGFSEGKYTVNGKVFEAPSRFSEDPERRELVLKAKIITIPDEWKYNKYIEIHNNPYDFAGFILDREVSIEENYFHPKHHDDSKLIEKVVSVTGYLKAGEENKYREMHTMKGKIKEACNHRVHYEINTRRGQSGSPVWYQHKGVPICTAVHIGTHHATLNTGTRLTNPLIRYIENEWSINLQ